MKPLKPYVISNIDGKVIRIPALDISIAVPLVEESRLRSLITNMIKCESLNKGEDYRDQIVNDIIVLIKEIRQNNLLSANYIRR